MIPGPLSYRDFRETGPCAHDQQRASSMYSRHGVSTDQFIFRTILARIFNIFKVTLYQRAKPTDLKMVLRSLSNNDGAGYGNVR